VRNAAIGILKLISEGEGDIRKGRVKSQENVFKDIEDRRPISITPPPKEPMTGFFQLFP